MVVRLTWLRQSTPGEERREEVEKVLGVRHSVTVEIGVDAEERREEVKEILTIELAVVVPVRRTDMGHDLHDAGDGWDVVHHCEDHVEPQRQHVRITGECE